MILAPFTRMYLKHLVFFLLSCVYTLLLYLYLRRTKYLSSWSSLFQRKGRVQSPALGSFLWTYLKLWTRLYTQLWMPCYCLIKKNFFSQFIWNMVSMSNNLLLQWPQQGHDSSNILHPTGKTYLDVWRSLGTIGANKYAQLSCEGYALPFWSYSQAISLPGSQSNMNIWVREPPLLYTNLVLSN